MKEFDLYHTYKDSFKFKLSKEYLYRYSEMKTDSQICYQVKVKHTPYHTELKYDCDLNGNLMNKFKYTNNFEKTYVKNHSWSLRSVEQTAKADNLVKPLVFGEREEKNVRRAKQNLFDIVECNVCKDSCFLTLTYEENMVDYIQACKDFANFTKRFEYYYEYKMKYIMTMERQERGAWHFHLIVFNMGFNNDLLDNTFAEKVWCKGFIKAKRVYAQNGVSGYAEYIAKYITKETSNTIPLGKQLYKCSNGLKRAEIEYLMLNDLIDWWYKNQKKCISNYEYACYQSVNENGELVSAYCSIEKLENQALWVGHKELYNISFIMPKIDILGGENL